MSLKNAYRSLLLMLFIGLFCSSTRADDDVFTQDSLQIVENAAALLQKPEIKSIEEVQQFLNRNLKRSNAATDDFIQFSMAKHFYLTQQIPIAKRIINKNIEDNYNEDYSDAK